jgi:hypothetical protein
MEPKEAALESAADSPKIGRPTKLTPEVEKKIRACVGMGMPFARSAMAAGVSYTAFKEWVARGKAGEEPYASFAAALKEAKADGEAMLLGRIVKAAGDDQWQAAAWILERRHPESYGRRDRVEVTGKKGGPVQVDARKLSDEQLRRLAAGEPYAEVVATIAAAEARADSGDR